MNNTCNGHWMKKEGLYRCLMDGKLIVVKEKPKVCPTCKRPVMAKTTRGQVRFKSVVNIRVPGPFGWHWEEFAPVWRKARKDRRP